MNIKTQLKYPLERYRQFIREAAPYVSLVIGRRIAAPEADLLSDEQIREIGLKIDQRVKSL